MKALLSILRYLQVKEFVFVVYLSTFAERRFFDSLSELTDDKISLFSLNKILQLEIDVEK
jgi:hypothetical protein